MRKISANLILPVSSPPLKNGIITLDDEGRILKVVDTGGKLREESGLEFYNGVIIPGFVLAWLRLNEFANGSDHPEDTLKKLDRDFFLNGIKGVGLVLRESMLSDVGFKLMRNSPLIYHPVIELCPERGEDEFEVFNRGIDLASRIWNEFNLSCSLTACSAALKNSDIGKYLLEYASSHKNVSPPEKSRDIPGSGLQPLNLLKTLQFSLPEKSLTELLPRYTLRAAAGIFEDDVLGSIESGKKPGLSLVSGLDPETFRPGKKSVLKVLV